MASFEIKGFKELQQKLKGLPKEIENKVDREIKATVADINADQVARAPVDTSFLRKMTYWRPTGKMQYTLFSNAPYAAYVEFGTGALVNVPAGLEDYAIQFKGKGIKQVNLPARNYFFTPFLQEKDALLKRLNKIINQV
jgi:hypothetical protein